jgi:general secretion pathway protein K
MSFAASCPRSSRSSNARNRAREGGWALVSVLWALTMIALMAAAAQSLTVTAWMGERHAMTDARADADLDAAVVRAVLGISDTRSEQRWRTDGTKRVIVYDGLRIRVSAQDELGRIDLNAASTSLIRTLLMGHGLSPDDATTLSDRIADWRSTSGLVSLHGATDADYRAAGLSYLPRHGPFQTVDEARLVLGMSPALFARIRPALTVYSKRPAFDPALAPREALMALYPSDPGKIDAILRARSGDIGLAQPGTTSSTPAPLTVPFGRAYEITAELAIGMRTFKRDAVVEMTGDDKRAYFVLAWR